MTAKIYRFSYRADDIQFEAEGDRTFVLEMIHRFGPEGRGRPVVGKKGKSAASSVPLARQPVVKAISPREFVQQLSLKKHTDIVLAFGYFLEKYRGNSDFTSADINNCYYEAKMESSNTSQMIINVINRGHMMESKKKGEKGRNVYTLTATGEQFIEKKLAPKP